MTGRKAIKKLAKEQGVSEVEIRKEIQIAINEAMKNPSPKVQMMWKNMSKKHEVPTPEEVIEFVSREVKSKKQKIINM